MFTSIYKQCFMDVVRLALVQCLLCMILLISNVGLNAKEVPSKVVFVTSAYEPYVISQNGTVTGVFPDIIREALMNSGFTLEIQLVPWLRGEHALKMGKAFASFPYLETKERGEKFIFSETVINFFPKFFYLKLNFPDGFEWNKLDDFNGYTLGGVLGYWYVKRFKQAGLKTFYAASDKQNIILLERNRIDFTLIDELVGWDLVRKIFPDDLDSYGVASKPESGSAFHLMISPLYPNAKEITKRFNLGLQKIIENGIYQKILDKYNVPKEYSVEK